MPAPRIRPAPTDAILERLMALHPKRIDLSLGRMYRLLDRLGHPERHLPPVVHVAGTNGKGSTIAYLRAMFEAAGRTAHVYTSPHLVRFAERIRLAGEIIAEDYFAEILARCEAANRSDPITFFEITTAAAFLAFRENPADVLLLETGLGGRLDATNVIDAPALTAISPIAIDHVQYLGPTLESIAIEKAGIMRRGALSVTGPQAPVVDRVLAQAAGQAGAGLYRHGVDWWVAAGGDRLVWHDAATALDLPEPALAGRHQWQNAGLAVACARNLGDLAPPDGAIAAGLLRVDWPGRLQPLTTGPLMALAPDGAEIWLDGGHNGAAGSALAQAMRAFAGNDPEPRPLHLIVAMLNSKDPQGFLAPFREIAAGIHATAIPGETASLSHRELARAGAGLGLTIDAQALLSGAMAAVREAVTAGPPPRILICGSLYLAGHILAENA